MGIENEQLSRGQDASDGTLDVDGQLRASESTEMNSLIDIASRVGLSDERIRALLKVGRITGEFRRAGRGPGKWFTSISAVQQYQEECPTAHEIARMGGLAGGRGRPKSETA